METPEQSAHRAFLNHYYGRVKHLYDASRKYYLFGRDRALRRLLSEPWQAFVEVGPGTGRNLAKLHAARPTARYGGVDASDEMLAYARGHCPWARLEYGFAEEADFTRLLGEAPERILFSYCLSMVQDADAALRNARRQLAPDGVVVVVDFGDMGGMPLFTGAMRRFLRAFHVATPDLALLRKHGAELSWGPGRYYLTARMGPLSSE